MLKGFGDPTWKWWRIKKCTAAQAAQLRAKCARLMGTRKRRMRKKNLHKPRVAYGCLQQMYTTLQLTTNWHALKAMQNHVSKHYRHTYAVLRLLRDIGDRMSEAMWGSVYESKTGA